MRERDIYIYIYIYIYIQKIDGSARIYLALHTYLALRTYFSILHNTKPRDTHNRPKSVKKKTKLKAQKHSKSLKTVKITNNETKLNKNRQNQPHPRVNITHIHSVKYPRVKITHIHSVQHPRVDITHIHSIQHPLTSPNWHSILQNSNPLNSNPANTVHVMHGSTLVYIYK